MPRKSGKGKGGKKGGKGGKDPVTGRSIEYMADGRLVAFQDDVVYEVTKGSPDTYADDIYTPLKAVPIGPPREGAYYLQVQLGGDRMIFNSYGRIADPVQYRVASFGGFTYDKNGRMARMSISSDGTMQMNDDNSSPRFGYLTVYSPPSVPSLPYDGGFHSGTELASYDWGSGSGAKETGGGLAAIRAFGGGKYFFEGWQNNLFDTSLA
jgi:hypothetical protein